jgi:hypothetical protein
MAMQRTAEQSIAKHIGKPAMVYRWVFHQWQRMALHGIAVQCSAKIFGKRVTPFTEAL